MPVAPTGTRSEEAFAAGAGLAPQVSRTLHASRRRPTRSAKVGPERRGRQARTPVAAMASVVEYKGLKAGYHCGYCDSEEDGKVSYGECSRGGVSAAASRTTSVPPAAPRASPAPGRP